MVDAASSLIGGGSEENWVDVNALEEYWEAFELFDKDGDGTISTGELKNLLRCFDVDMPDDKVQQLIEKHDSTEDGCIEFASLVEIMKTIQETQEMDQEIQEVYRLFANDEQGVSPDKLYSTMNQLLQLKHEFYQDGENQHENGETPDIEDRPTPDNPPSTLKSEVTQITREDAEWLVGHYDTDEDGKLNLEEFAAIFTEKS